jgi:hypothetical protein
VKGSKIVFTPAQGAGGSVDKDGNIKIPGKTAAHIHFTVPAHCKVNKLQILDIEDAFDDGWEKRDHPTKKKHSIHDKNNEKKQTSHPYKIEMTCKDGPAQTDPVIDNSGSNY